MLRLAICTNAETFERIGDPLAKRGIDVVYLQAKSRTIRVTETPDRRADPIDPAPETIDVGFVYPSRMMEGAALDARLDVPWVTDREAVLTSRNKAGVLSELDAAGLPVPQTLLVSNPVAEAAVLDAVDAFEFPVVVKPNSSTRGIGVTKAADVDDLSGVIDYLDLAHDYRATGDKSYLIQEYLPNARDYRLMVVDGDCVGGVERRIPPADADAGRWKHNVHRGADAEGIAVPKRHRELAERAAETLGIPYLGVDLLETPDRLVVNETSARPTIDAARKYDDDFYDRLSALIERTANR